MNYRLMAALTILFLLFAGCSTRTDVTTNSNAANSASMANSPTPSASSSSSVVKQPPENPNKLTNAKVESAVRNLLSDFRFGGSVSVNGVQELPQQNSAVADLRFDNFEYPVTNEGRLLETRDFHPQSIPKNHKPTDPLPTMEQMFPPRKVSYSGGGRAMLTRYNDGRWVLKEVRWGQSFDSLGVTGTVMVN